MIVTDDLQRAIEKAGDHNLYHLIARAQQDWDRLDGRLPYFDVYIRVRVMELLRRN